MRAALGDFQFTILNTKDDSVLIVYFNTPKTTQIMFKWLWLTYSVVSVTLDILQEFVYLL